MFTEGTLRLDDGALLDVAEELRRGDRSEQIRALRCFENVDGEFLLVVRAVDEDRVWIVTDRYGHLPLYHAQLGEGCVVTRDFPIACELAGAKRVDQLAVAGYLVFNFVPGCETPHPGVRTVPPGALSTITDGQVATTRWNHWEGDLRPAGSGGQRPRHAVDAVVESLVDTCRWRLSQKGDTPVVSLSGGLDSRAVVAALRRSWAHPLPAATFGLAEGDSIDVPVARRVAHVAGMPWTLEELPPTGEDEQNELFEIKRGLNSLRMAFILPFFHSLLRQHGSRVRYVTGDTGLLVRPVLPRRSIRSADDFLARLFVGGRFHRHAVFSSGQACRAARIRESEFREWLVETAISLDPQGDWERRFMVFVLDGYGRRWHYEGMDRNRYYFWLEAPLESTPVMNVLLSVPDRAKRHLGFFGAVVRALDRELASIPKAGQSFPPGSRAQLLSNQLWSLRMRVASRIPGRRGARSAVRPTASASTSWLRAREVWESSEAARSAFDLDACRGQGVSGQAAATALGLARFWARSAGED